MNKDEMIKSMARVVDKTVLKKCKQSTCEKCKFERRHRQMNNEPACIGQLISDELYNAGYRKVGDVEIVIKKSEYEELEKELEKTKLALKIREDTWGIGYDDAVKNYTEQICNIAKKETAREILETVRKVYGNNHGLILWLKTTYDIE